MPILLAWMMKMPRYLVVGLICSVLYAVAPCVPLLVCKELLTCYDPSKTLAVGGALFFVFSAFPLSQLADTELLFCISLSG